MACVDFIGASTARVARVRTLPTFGNPTWTRPKFCSEVIIDYTPGPYHLFNAGGTSSWMISCCKCCTTNMPQLNGEIPHVGGLLCHRFCCTVGFTVLKSCVADFTMSRQIYVCDQARRELSGGRYCKLVKSVHMVDDIMSRMTC